MQPSQELRELEDGNMSTSTTEDRVLWETEIRDELLRVTTHEYRNTQYTSIRFYWKNNAGEWCPGKKGITFNSELTNEIIAALEAVEEGAAA
jgi:hypothetical protein